MHSKFKRLNDILLHSFRKLSIIPPGVILVLGRREYEEPHHHYRYKARKSRVSIFLCHKKICFSKNPYHLPDLHPGIIVHYYTTTQQGVMNVMNMYVWIAIAAVAIIAIIYFMRCSCK